MSRKIDALIAEHVMGLKEVCTPLQYIAIMTNGGDFFGRQYFCLHRIWNETYKKHIPGKTIPIVKDYSTSIEDAWEVVKKMSGRTWVIHLRQTCGNDWICEFKKIDIVLEAIADTAPMSICLAALAARGVKVDKE